MLDSITDHPCQEPDDCYREEDFEGWRDHEENMADLEYSDADNSKTSSHYSIREG